LLNELAIGKAADQLKKMIICEPDDETIRKLAKFGIEVSEKKEDFGNDYLEIFKLSENKNSLKTGLILFKYILQLLNPFAPFLSQHLYDKLYSSSLLLSKRDDELLRNLVSNLTKVSLEKEEKYLVIRQNSKIMALLFYPLVREIRNFKEKYLFKEKLII
jgi:valyl-tRNA synthetase